MQTLFCTREKCFFSDTFKSIVVKIDTLQIFYVIAKFTDFTLATHLL